MADLFKILVVDENTFENHIGEECDDLKELSVSPSKRLLSEYGLYFKGIVRSVWKEVSQEIEIVLDVESELYNTMLETLSESMKEEGITFQIRRLNG